MSKQPLVSAVIPVFNCEDFLSEALKSVFSQTYSNIETIVVDDGSTDDSAEIAGSYPEVDYYYQENQGVSAARNTGISSSEGEFVAFLDADDVWKPEKTKAQIDYMKSHSECEISATKGKNFLEANTKLPPGLKEVKDWDKINYVIPSTMMVRKSVFDEIGGFSTEFRASEDVEWTQRAKDAGLSIGVVEEVLVKRRFHGSNLSWKMIKGAKDRMLKILRASLNRRSS